MNRSDDAPGRTEYQNARDERESRGLAEERYRQRNEDRWVEYPPAQKDDWFATRIDQIAVTPWGRAHQESEIVLKAVDLARAERCQPKLDISPRYQEIRANGSLLRSELERQESSRDGIKPSEYHTQPGDTDAERAVRAHYRQRDGVAPVARSKTTRERSQDKARELGDFAIRLRDVVKQAAADLGKTFDHFVNKTVREGNRKIGQIKGEGIAEWQQPKPSQQTLASNRLSRGLPSPPDMQKKAHAHELEAKIAALMATAEYERSKGLEREGPSHLR